MYPATQSGVSPAAASGGSKPKQKYPFLWGTKEQWVQIAQIPYAAGLKAPTTKLPKNGYGCVLRFKFVGKSNVSGAGSSGTPKLYNLINNYTLSFNGGFQYRNLDGESLYVKNGLQVGGSTDPVTGGPNYLNYNPASATNQNIQFVVTDYVALNPGINADKFLLAAQARNADITLDITFDSGTNVVANTETTAFSGTLYVEALYLLDPNYNEYAGPDLSEVQQCLTDASFTNVQAGVDNIVPIVPINGPQYMQLAFKILTNNTADPGGFSSNASRIRLRLNNNQDMYDYSLQALQQSNFEHFGRSLPTGWYLLDWLDDINIVNAVSPIGRNIISTEKISALWLIVTINSGVTVTQPSVIKLLKRVKTPAVSI